MSLSLQSPASDTQADSPHNTPSVCALDVGQETTGCDVRALACVARLAAGLAGTVGAALVLSRETWETRGSWAGVTGEPARPDNTVTRGAHTRSEPLTRLDQAHVMLTKWSEHRSRDHYSNKGL